MLKSMKTYRTARTAVPALAILAWLLVPQTAQCFYNPSTGKWMSRDPVKEQGFRITGSRAIIGAEPYQGGTIAIPFRGEWSGQPIGLLGTELQ